MWRNLLPLFFLFPGALHAQASMTAEAFESYTTGKTLTFSADGYPYGAEEYREGREVLWSFLDGECREGTWYPEGDTICFVYETGGVPQCWRFFQEGAGLRAEFASDSPGGALYETQTSDEPLLCYGPKVGV